jgi:predicted ATPase with chaperone activity
VPRTNASEAAVVEGLEVIAVDSLAQTVAFFAGEIDLAPTPGRIDDLFERFRHYDIDFDDVRGQESAAAAQTLPTMRTGLPLSVARIRAHASSADYTALRAGLDISS